MLVTEVVPMLVPNDIGPANGPLPEITFLTPNGNDSFPNTGVSFLYGTSPQNQHIEKWWGYLRKENSKKVLDVFI